MLIQTYQKSWVADFNKIKAVLASNLQDVKVEIEHIGSTSIENLAAKAIIDIDIVYDDPKSFVRIKEGLEKLGYYHNGDQGIAGRAVFKRGTLEESHPVLDTIKHHLYVCHADNEELRRHLLFRDYLRKNEPARKAYEDLKYQIAALTNQDKKAYATLKETMARAFIESIIDKARHNATP